MNDLTAILREQRVRWGVPCTDIPGDNERCIEIPLALEVLQLDQPGWVLDAGCALNGHLYTDREPKAKVVHLTQAIASEPMHAKGASPLSYVSADLRDLRIFADGAFDRTVCVSTLEHVGLDNRSYGGPEENTPESANRALGELVRVTRGLLLVTVPYALEEWTNGRFRYITDRHWGRLADRAFYRRTGNTWQSCEREDLPPPGESVRGICALRFDCAA